MSSEGKKFTVKLTAAAEADLDEIYTYITNEFFAPAEADNIIKEIEESIFSLELLPYRFTLSRIEALANKGYHILIIKNYVAPYLIHEDDLIVIVARVFHGSMNYQDYL